jgi:hypothetical protein
VVLLRFLLFRLELVHTISGSAKLSLVQVGVSAYNELFRLSPQAIHFFPKLLGYKEGEKVCLK